MAYDQTIAINNNSYEAWRRKGIVLEKIKCYKEALVCYDRALAIQPDDSESQLKRLTLLSKLQSERVLTEKNKYNLQVNLDVSNNQDKKLKKIQKNNPIVA